MVCIEFLIMNTKFVQCCVFLSICLICLPYESFCVDQQYEVCSKARYCGNQIIQFPFFIQQEASYCGYPGFELTCVKNESLILKVSEGEYKVDEIFYSNNSVRVSNLLSLEGALCSLPKITNLQLPSDGQFQLHNNSNIILLSNCTSESAEKYSNYKVGCDLQKNDTDWVLVMREYDANISHATEACKTVKLAPVDNHSGDDGNYLELLRNGFVLKWNASNCSDCEASGEYCGNDGEPINKINCFCANRPHSRSCKSRKQPPSYSS